MFFINVFSIGGLLIYNIVLVSAIHQHETAICIPMSLLLESPSLPIPPL